MKYSKNKVSKKDWELLAFSPIYIAVGVAEADGIINVEEIEPLHGAISSLSTSGANQLVIDVFGELYDKRNNGELWNEYNELIKDEPMNMEKKGKEIGNTFSSLEIDSDDLFEFQKSLFTIGFLTGISYGRPDAPLDPSESDTLKTMFRWMGLNHNDFIPKDNSSEVTNTVNQSKTTNNKTPKEKGEAGFV